MNGDIPHRVWSGKEVSYDHLKVFGCRAFVHIPHDERAKFDAKTKQCIFLGYGHDEFGYRLWDPVNKKVVRSRDVVFFEDQTIEDIEKTDKKEKAREEEMLQHSPTSMQDEVGKENLDGEENPAEVNEQGEQPQEAQAPLRRSSRVKQPSKKYPKSEFLFLTDGGEPDFFDEAMEHENKVEWLKAMQEEMSSLQENSTYELVKLPKEP